MFPENLILKKVKVFRQRLQRAKCNDKGQSLNPSNQRFASGVNTARTVVIGPMRFEHATFGSGK